MADPLIDQSESSLARCGGCGYWLHALPPKGNCPECDEAYDSSRIVLLGWARGSGASVLSSRGGVVVWTLALMLFQLGQWSIVRAVAGALALDPRGLMLCAAYVGVIAAALIGRWNRIMRETTRVVLCDEGFCQETIEQRDGPLFVLLPISVVCLVVALGVTSGEPLRGWHIVVAPVVIAVVVLVGWLFRHRKQRASLVPWEHAKEARLSGEGHSKYRLRIDRRQHWFAHDVVNMDLDLTIPQRDGLERRLVEWATSRPAEPRRLGLG